MAVFQSSSLFNPSLSSPNNQQHSTTHSNPTPAQLSTLRPLPFCFPSLSTTTTTTTSSPITPILRSAYNVQVIAADNEPEEKLIGRFRREVLRAGVIQESKRRRFFESTLEKKKRKSKDAARRNRKRRPQPKALPGDTKETLKDEWYKSDEDKWDLIDVELPYT